MSSGRENTIQMEAIQSTAAIEIRHERLSKRNGRRTNRSGYKTCREMNIPMIRIIVGMARGSECRKNCVPMPHGVFGVSLTTSPFVLYGWVWRDSATKTIMGMTSGMGRVRDRPAEHPAAPPSSSNSTQSTQSFSLILSYNVLHDRCNVEIGGW